MTIIDARVRLPQDQRPRGSYEAPKRQTEQYDKVLDLTEKMNSGTLRGLLAALDDQGIGRAVMHAESEGGEDADVLNQALAAVVGRHPDRFIGIGCVDVGTPYPTEMARQVVRAAELGHVGVSFQPAFFGLDIDDRRLYPLYARAEEMGLVVAVHTGITYSRMHPLRHEKPELLDQVACDFPDLKLIACHAGWPWATEYAAVARRHPTVYLEFGALAPKYVARAGTGWDAMFAMMPTLLREQVLYGSDWPMMEPARAIAEWRASGLPADALEALFCSNAQRLFGPALEASQDG
ncbi:amidohydrolase family protein [Ornithinicoccus halotolerans]|uniref:amidohydrolase family protein n=1 Tax=Ornithinicoccus halotolerans TaxID=1748220 RepID=UPI001294F470|nr:amidohydrolase family protein [Ornithinicoccus halotolerans]